MHINYNTEVGVRSSSHAVFNIKAHLVLVVAYRRTAITENILVDLEQCTRRVCSMSEVSVLEFSGESDHVHALLELHPGVMPSRLVNSIKTVTSRIVRKYHWDSIRSKLWGRKFWSGSYCLMSVGDGATTDIIKNYIKKQTRPS